MADIVSAEKRREMMSGIRGKDTRPEMILRRALHRLGYRYRLHSKDLPGCPDIVFGKYRAVIFVHGCFWHLHDCHLFKWPKTRADFWRKKLHGNAGRDRTTQEKILNAGWRICILWECALKGKERLPLDTVVDMIDQWLKSDLSYLEVRGQI